MSTRTDAESDRQRTDPRRWPRQPSDDDLGYEVAPWQRIEGDDGKFRFLPEDYETGSRQPVLKADGDAIVDLVDHV